MYGSAKTRIIRWARRRRGITAPLPVLAVAATVVITVGVTAGFTAALTGPAAGPQLTRQQFAQRILKTQAAQVMTAPALAAVRMMATRSRDLSPGPMPHGLEPRQSPAPAGAAGPPLKPAGLGNVRVNDPALDTSEPDQTTQSEPAIAVSGQRVAVGYNDSQQTGLALTAGSDLTGYSYSDDGGASFHDGGALPDTPEFVNLGDPWLAASRAGAMYFSNLALDTFNDNLDVTVARSSDGGRTWGTPVPVYRPPVSIFYDADKPAIAAGPDPVAKHRDNLYTAWDDFAFTESGRFYTGLPVARSTDGGATWHLAYAKRFNLTNTRGCSFAQFIGATPVVSRATGTLYVAAEKLSVSDPRCTGTTAVQRSEWIFRSADGGKTFGTGVKIAAAAEAVPGGLLSLGPGRYLRDLEFPAIALRGRAIYVAWNNGTRGRSHIRLATSVSSWRAWTVRYVTSGSDDQLQPALSADGSGIHLLYYNVNPGHTLDVLAGNSHDGTRFATQRVTTQSFPGALTIPQFDPILEFGYMGDYIANVSDGPHQYFAWGDNRDTVTGPLYPGGRSDPDVFLARQ